MFCRKRRGFTMVELMMVVLIIGLLVALLLPAVNAVRESGRRAACLHKMRELGSAVLQYENAQQHYPGWRHFFKITDHHQLPQTSWTVLALPYMSRSDLYGDFKRNGPTTQNCVAMRSVLVCPSDFEKMQAAGPVTSFVGNTGRTDRFDLAETNNLPPDSRTNGVFMHVYNQNNANVVFM